MFQNLLGATPAGQAAGSIAGLASGGPSSAESGSSNDSMFGAFNTGDTNKGSGKSQAEIITNGIVKVGAILGAGLTIYTVAKMVSK